MTSEQSAFPLEAASAVFESPSPALAAAPVPENLFIPVPKTTLPNGIVVPPFQVGQYLCSRSADGRVAVTSEGTPWVDISYHAAREVCLDAGFALITELQALALAHNIAQLDGNWTGRKVGEGDLFQGLRNDTVEEAQPGTYVSPDPTESRAFILSNGVSVYDAAGNAYTWVFDDVQGDEQGLIARKFAKDSPSITTAPAASMQKGVGWYPRAGSNWSGDALIRGGCWGSESYAGVFILDIGWPDHEYDYVGFRCTRPGL
jgi:formylglycine-generating enzyme required for sulfatase activity